MADIIPITSPPDPLQELQQRYCLFKLAGGIWVAELDDIKSVQAGTQRTEVAMYRKEDGKLLMQRHLETVHAPSEPKKVVANFMVSSNTKVYDAVAFSPLPVPEGTLNYWTGSPVIPKKGDWSTVKSFLLWVICGGDIGLYRYLVMFLGHMLLKPHEKPGIMIVLLGGQGTGKGTFFSLLHALWSRTTLLVSDVSHVIGSFNAGIERNYVLCMDEALFAGDKKTTERLKSFVTERQVTIEQKYQPRRNIESFHRMFSSSNHAHFAQVDADERRFLFMEVSDAYQGDFAYWEDVHAAIANQDVISAMVHDLQSLDLSMFNVRARPKTNAHTDQKLRSLSGFDRYWFEVLGSGEFDDQTLLDATEPWSTPCFISTDKLKGGWKSYEKGQRLFGGRQEREMHAAMRRLCPSAKLGRHQSKLNGQKRGYSLPSLTVARAEFAKAIGGEVHWDD